MSKYYRFDGKRNTSYLSLWLLMVVILISSSLTWKLGHDKNQEIHKLKVQSKTYFDAAVQNQLNYENSREELTHAQQDLADARARLAKAAAREKQAAREIRASRSRRAGPVSDQQHKSTSSSVFTGGLRDITMYCPTGNSTASGKTPQRGMVATISRSIPFGTRILIEGFGEYVVEDRIGHGSEFDIFTPSCSEADEFGRHHAHVTILDAG